MNLDHATVLITGANRGLGLAFASEALARGARKVYASVRDPSELTLPGVEAIQLDVNRPEQVAAAAQRCTDVTLLINNAGIAAFGGFLSADSIDSARAHLAGAEEVLADERARQIKQGSSAGPGVYLQDVRTGTKVSSAARR